MGQGESGERIMVGRCPKKTVLPGVSVRGNLPQAAQAVLSREPRPC